MRIIKGMHKFFFNTVNFGLYFAFQNFIENHVPCFNTNLIIAQRREKNIKNYLIKNYSDIIKEFNSNCILDSNCILVRNETNIKPFTIWTCWWQGEDNMPDIIKICYRSMFKYANGNRVILITRENYRNYVNIPGYIIKKLHKGIISLTHFSDILRICLLCEYGGLWLDATVFLTSPLQDIAFEFFSLKCKNDLWENINKKRWLIFVLYALPHNILPEFTQKVFFKYWKNHNLPMDYYLFDFIFDIAYDTIPNITKLIDDIPLSDAVPHFIHNNLNEKYNPVLYNQICSTTHFHKLNWKMSCRKYTENGELTYYGYIIQLGET